MNPNVHKELKEALRLYGITITEFANSLVNPISGKIGVTHPAVIQVSKGINATSWILEEIESIIQRAHSDFPEYYKRIAELKNSVA